MRPKHDCERHPGELATIEFQKAVAEVMSQREGAERCVTHHHACSCREEAFKVLLTEVMHQHADEDSCFYNECDTAPCDWCVEAEKLVGPITPYKNPKREC